MIDPKGINWYVKTLDSKDTKLDDLEWKWTVTQTRSKILYGLHARHLEIWMDGLLRAILLHAFRRPYNMVHIYQGVVRGQKGIAGWPSLAQAAWVLPKSEQIEKIMLLYCHWIRFALIELINLTCSIWKNSKSNKNVSLKNVSPVLAYFGHQNVPRVALKRSQGLHTSYGKYKKVIITINTKT